MFSTRNGKIIEAPADAPAIALREVRKVYGQGEGAVVALDGISIGLPRGSFTAIMGPSWSGKSTFLHVAAGLDRPTSGTVALGDTELAGLSERRLTMARLAPHLPESLLPAALEALADSPTRASALSESIAALSEHERPEAARLAVAAAAGDAEAEPFATAAAAPYLSQAERSAALRSALVATDHMNPQSRASALVALIPHLDGRKLRKAIKRLDAAQLSADLLHARLGQAFALVMPYTVETTLAYLRDGDIKRLLGPTADARLVAAFAPRLSSKQALSLLSALDDTGEETRAAFAALAPRLDGASRARLLEHLQQRDAVDLLIVVAQALAPDTRGPWLAAALAAAHRTEDPGTRAEALLELVSQLSGTQRGAAIEAAHQATTQIAHFAQYVLCARAVAELLPEDDGAQLAAIALDRVPDDQRVACIAHLSPVLGAERDNAVTDAFAEVSAIADPVDRAMALVELAPHLPDTLVDDAVASALANPHSDARLVAIAALAPRLGGEHLAQLLRSCSEPLSHARGIADLVAHLGPSSAPAASR